MTRMSRTTVMVDDALLDELRAIAKEDGISLGEVIRQGLEWRAKLKGRPPSFVGRAAAPRGPHAAARRHEELVAEYVREKHARR
jgi:hypothetical protein